MLLAEDCEVVYYHGRSRVRLNEQVRATTISRLIEGGVDLDEVTFSDDLDAPNVMARRYLAGTAPNVGSQSSDELHATAQILDWFRNVDLGLPSPPELRAQERRSHLLDPLRSLVADGVYGRVPELAELYEYAEVFPPATQLKASLQQVRRLFRLSVVRH